jgi:hypothetical protein
MSTKVKKQSVTNKSTTKQQPPTPPKMKNKTISLKDIQKQAKKLDQMSTYILDVDYETKTNTVIKYYEEFSQSRIDELLKEAYLNLEIAEKEDIKFFKQDDYDANFLFYINFLIAVRFTSLDKDVPSSVSEQLPIMMDLYNRGLLNRIHDEVLNQSEVAKVTEKLEQFQTLVSKIADLEQSTREQIKSTVKNSEILGRNDSVIHPLVNPSVSPTSENIGLM